MNIDIEMKRKWCYSKSIQGWSVRLIASHLSRQVHSAQIDGSKGAEQAGLSFTNLSRRPKEPYRRILSSVEDEINIQPENGIHIGS